MALCLAKVKFGLAFLLCSYIAETCLPPHIYEIEFDSEYDCLVVGYEESLNKIIEIKTNIAKISYYLDKF